MNVGYARTIPGLLKLGQIVSIHAENRNTLANGTVGVCVLECMMEPRLAQFEPSHVPCFIRWTYICR